MSAKSNKVSYGLPFIGSVKYFCMVDMPMVLYLFLLKPIWIGGVGRMSFLKIYLRSLYGNSGPVLINNSSFAIGLRGGYIFVTVCIDKGL